MTNTERILEIYQHQMTQTTRVFFAFLAFTILLMVFLTIYKKKQRESFWIVGVTLFVSILLLVSFNVLDLSKRLDLIIAGWGVIFSGFYVYAGESVHKKFSKTIAEDISEVKQKANQEEPDENVEVQNNEQINVEPSKDDKDNQLANVNEVPSWTEILPPMLETELAIKVFDRAREKKLLTVEDGCLKWHGKSKVLLAYMCGRIYCNDYSEYDQIERKNFWKEGEDSFPETELNSLFRETSIGQSRRNQVWKKCPEGFRTINTFFD